MILALLLACAHAPLPPVAPPEAPVTLDPLAVAGVSDPVLQRLLHDHWQAVLQASPEWATRLGDHRQDDRLSDRSPEARAAWAAARDGFLLRAWDVDPATLSPADAVTLQLFVAQLEQDAREEVCRAWLWQVGPRFNVVGLANELWRDFGAFDEAAGRALLARYRQLPRRIAQETEDLRVGLATGWVPDAETLARTIELVEAELARPPEELELLAPTRLPLSDWDPVQAEAFRAETRQVVEESVLPALRAHLGFLQQELLPGARPPEQVGIRALPEGEACYAALIQGHTTLPLSGDEVHQRGLDAMAAVHAELSALGGRALGTEDVPEIIDRLRGDATLRFETSEQVVDKARDALARAQAALPQVVSTATPATPCGVEAMPEYEAPWAYIAYYRPPTEGKGGTYVVNATEPQTRTRHEAEVLAFHEAVPGHHLQIAAAQEQGSLPAFRRHAGFTAFVEGWALYSERVADQVGLYSGDLDRLGMLSFDAWRSARLVVDTGIHHLGWTREQAVAYMRDHTPLALENIDNEVDRYISWPGQALGYKLGQLEILSLRAEAEAALGPAFDPVHFHDLLLTGGAVTLPVLRQRVEAWVAQGGGPILSADPPLQP